VDRVLVPGVRRVNRSQVDAKDPERECSSIRRSTGNPLDVSWSCPGAAAAAARNPGTSC
jgi:hypothetical protein